MTVLPLRVFRPPSGANPAGELVVTFPSGLPRSLRLELEAQESPPEAWAINWVDAEGNLVFHFNPRPARDCVAINAFQHGAWGEETIVPSFPFPGQPEVRFRVVFEALEEGFVVEVDGRRFCAFPHGRIRPRSASCDRRSPCGASTPGE